MAIKLIALDLDGTLLTSEKHVSPATKEILETCMAHGVEVVLATGRMGAGIPEELKRMDGIRYVIGANGAAVEDIRDRKLLHSCKIPFQTALVILDMVKAYPLMYDAHVNGQGMAESSFLKQLEYYVPEETIRSLITSTRCEVGDLRSYIEAHRADVDKFNLTFQDEKVREEVRMKLAEIGDIAVTSSLKNNLELNQKDATKGNGLLFLTEYLGLKQEETMAFGDADNDLSMLIKAGLGVAMGNALPQVKAQADFVTESNDEDGIAAAIRKFVL